MVRPYGMISLVVIGGVGRVAGRAAEHSLVPTGVSKLFSRPMSRPPPAAQLGVRVRHEVVLIAVTQE